MQRRDFLASAAGCLTMGVAGLSLSPRAGAQPAAGSQGSGAHPSTAAASGQAFERASRLRLGVNLGHWHWLPPGRPDWSNRDGLVTSAELTALAAAGATHVRLPIEPADYWQGDERGGFLKDGYHAIRQAIDKVVEAGLAVVVDCHPRNAAWMRVTDEGRAPWIEAFWDRFAQESRARVGTLDPERVFLEVLNEPHDLKDPQAWPKAQARLVALIRERFPNHTIIATGDEWGSIDGLLRLSPVRDDNVIYSFHFYDPHNFTHQGATWGFEPWRHMKGVGWPMTRESVEPLLGAIEDQRARDALRWSVKEAWDAPRLRTRIERAAEWSTRHGVPLYCGEFGVYARYAPREARLAWLRDVTRALDDCGIGRAMWDYAGGFGLMEEKAGVKEIDREVARAIGMKG